jgi:protein TonB
MFEQSLLTNPPAARKTAAFCASLAAQILAGGVLLAAPLIFTDALPAFRGFDLPLPIPVFRAPEAPPEVASAAPRRARSYNLFRAPSITVPRTIPVATPVIIDSNLPAADFFGEAPPSPLFAIQSTPAAAAAPPPPAQAKAPPPSPAGEPPPAGPLRVNSGVQAARIIHQVLPKYPLAAKQTRTEGVVQLLAIIGVDGKIRRIEVLSGHPLLRQAAVDAVRQWVYSPTVLSGVPVEVEAPVEVRFKLDAR